MLIDSPAVREGTGITNLTAPSGANLPNTEISVGEMFYKTGVNAGFYGADGTVFQRFLYDSEFQSHVNDADLHLSSGQNTWLDSIIATSAEVNYLSGVTGAIQTQLNNKLALAGGTMTGFITLHADPVSAMQAATKQYVDNALSGGTVTSVAATAPLAGFTIAGSPITTSGTLSFTLANDLAALEGLSGTGLAIRTGADAWATRTLTGTADQISIQNGTGVSGDPTISLASNVILPGNGAVTVPIGTAAQQPGSPVNGMIRYNSTDDKFEFREAGAWVPISGGGLIEYYTATATASQTLVNLPWSYSVAGNQLLVWVEGVKQVVDVDYTESSNVSITFDTGLALGDRIEIFKVVKTNVIGLPNIGTPGTYTQVTTDAQGRVTSGSSPTTLAGYGITDAAPISHVSDYTLHLTSGQNTWLDAVTVTSAEVNYLTGVTSNVQTQLGDKVAKAGSSMNSGANLVFSGGGTVTGIPNPTNGSDAANKSYVDNLTAGMAWQPPVDSTGASNPVSCTTGERFLNTTDDKIYTATATDTWDAGTTPSDGWSVFDKATETGYVYNGTDWTQFTGAGQITAGTGLSKSGNILNVNLGAGIQELPSDEIGIDIYTAGGLMLTVDGTTPSTLTNAQLSLLLDGTTLTKSASGLKLNTSGVGAGTYTSVTVDIYGRVTAGTNPGVGTFGDGSAAAPSIAFTADTDTGFYRYGNNAISVTQGGSETFRFNNGQLLGPDGSGAAPAFSFKNDTDTGIWLGGSNTMRLVAGGNNSLSIDSSNAYVNGTLWSGTITSGSSITIKPSLFNPAYSVTLEAGDTSSSGTQAGTAYVKGGSGSSWDGHGGDVYIRGGIAGATNRNSGAVILETLASTGTGNAGNVSIRTNNVTRFTIYGPSGAIGLGVGPSYGSAGQVLTSQGQNSAPIWSTINASPGGSTTQMQYNNAGSFAGASGITTDGTNLTLAGNLTMSGSAKRIIGDFSNATVASRVLFQTASTDSSTLVPAIPSGTGTFAAWVAYNSSDPANASYLSLTVGGAGYGAYLNSSVTGTGTQYPIGFRTGGLVQAQINHTASAVNYLTLTGSATTTAVAIGAAGTDTNISINLTPKGAGGVIITTGALTLSGDPTSALHAATKQYVDNMATGLDFKASVRVATTGNITLSGTQTIDGVAVIAGNRVLVKDQGTPAGNGIYVVAAGAWSRATDADNSPAGEVTSGMYCFVEEGSANANTGWVLSTANPITLGSTALTFVQFTGLGQITAGNGLTKTGSTLDIVTASSARIVVNANDIDLATTGVSASTYKSVTVDTYGRVTAGSNPTTLSGYGITDAVPLAGGVTMTGTLTHNVTSGHGVNSTTSATGGHGVYGSATGTGVGIYGTASANYGVYGITSSASYGGVIGFTQNTTYYGILGYNNAYAVYGNGDIYATGNVTAYSDERVKTNWRDFGENFVQRLASVKSGIYDRTDTELTQVGVSAQSLREVMEFAVTEDKDGRLGVSYGHAALAACVELAKECLMLREEIAVLRTKVA